MTFIRQFAYYRRTRGFTFINAFRSAWHTTFRGY